jgi:photosystem II stability/assembly factor-like uncharacterized protein
MKYGILYTLLGLVCGTTMPAWSQYQITPSFQEFSIDCSIRALEVLSEDHVWFAGSGGKFGYTTNSGMQWKIDSVQIDHTDLDFRSIAVTDKAVFMLNVATPAFLLRSTNEGGDWEIVYQEDHPGTFYDSMRFWDDVNGIAMGDPIDGCLSVIITNDGGDTWSKLDCGQLPGVDKGEAAFAASNSNIALYQQHAWMVTGGSNARVFHSPDMGLSWKVHDTPIVHGNTMTGIFTVDFYNDKHGIIFGGDWENQSMNTSNKAVTGDGGITWQLINDGTYPGYRSCVQYIPGSKGMEILATGSPGISYSGDGGKSWHHLGKENENYYTLRIARSGRTAWLAGKEKIARMKW